MTIRYHQRVSLFPGVHLNIGLSGISLNVGVPGANVTLGQRGAEAHLGLPGTGFRLDLPLRMPDSRPPQEKAPRGRRGGGASSPRSPLPAPPLAAIHSAAIDQLTSPGWTPLVQLFSEAKMQRQAAEGALVQARIAAEEARDALIAAERGAERAAASLASFERSWFKAFRGRRRRDLVAAAASWPATLRCAAEQVTSTGAAVAAAVDRLDQMRVDTRITLEPEAAQLWAHIVASFTTLSRSASIWDVTGERRQRVGTDRSGAARIVDRRPTTVGLASLDIIRSDVQPLHWRNENGDDLYLYPGFLVVYQSSRRFAIVAGGDLEFILTPSRFREDEPVPHDAQQVDTAWTYTNRDGSRDRRFADNPPVPVMLYAEITIHSSTGLHEAFLFSNATAALAFMDDLMALRQVAGWAAA